MELDSFGGCDFSGSSGAHEMKKASCCCTIGKAWGDDCELCPDRESQEHKKLCENFGLSKLLFRHKRMLHCLKQLYLNFCSNS